jgi:hypothetical protein
MGLALLIFLANYLIAGIETVPQTKLPHVEGDILFALALGLANVLIPFFLRDSYSRMPLLWRMGWFIVILNAGSYLLPRLFSGIGLHVLTWEAYGFAVLGVSVGSLGMSGWFIRSPRAHTPSLSPPSQLSNLQTGVEKKEG